MMIMASYLCHIGLTYPSRREKLSLIKYSINTFLFFIYEIICTDLDPWIQSAALVDIVDDCLETIESWTT